MKKHNLLIILVLLSLPTWAETYPFEGVKFQDTFDYLFMFKDGIYSTEIGNIETNGYIVEEAPYTLKKENGYLIAEIHYPEYISEIFIFSADDEHILVYDTHTKEFHYGSKLQGHRDEPYIWPVFDAQATSYLTEILGGKEVEYLPANISKYNFVSSWVEGVEGYGIGEKIWFESIWVNGGSRRFYIINGFFSPEKPSLYYDNGRVKSFHIKCFNKEHELIYECDKILEDTGELQIIEFPVRCSVFEYEITDVYPGRKYEDTAITGIFVDQYDVYMP